MHIDKNRKEKVPWNFVRATEFVLCTILFINEFFCCLFVPLHTCLWNEILRNNQSVHAITIYLVQCDVMLFISLSLSLILSFSVFFFIAEIHHEWWFVHLIKRMCHVKTNNIPQSTSSGARDSRTHHDKPICFAEI